MIDPFLKDVPAWYILLDPGKKQEFKAVIFDNDAIVSLIENKATSLLNEFAKLNVNNLYINPVYIELLNTNRLAKRVERQALLSKFNFIELPLTTDIAKMGLKIQKYLHTKDCYPSPTDLYLGATLAQYSISNGVTYLLTANIGDFPEPLFKRVSGVVIQSDKSVRYLSLLSFDPSVLI